MQSRIFSIMIIAGIAFNSCNATSENSDDTKQRSSNESTISAPAEQDIPYTVANRYFVNNTYTDGDLKNPKITSGAEFEKLFGAAPIMGPNGKPTVIDYSKEYVLAVIGKLTDKETSIKVNSLKQKGNMIIFSYKINEGEKLSMTIRPALLIIVDNKYQGDIDMMEIK